MSFPKKIQKWLVRTEQNLCVCMSGLVDEKELSDEFKKNFCSLGLLLEENKTQVSQRLVLIGTSQIIFE